MYILENNDPISVFDLHFTIMCPNCNLKSNISAVSIPRYEFMLRFRPKNVGIVYRCDACNEPVFLKFLSNYEPNNRRFGIDNEYTEVIKAQETFDITRLPKDVGKDFQEALICYSNCCYNAFAAMCRRTVQSISNELGAAGKDRVKKQIEELRDMAEIDDETFELLKVIVIAGHDGAHPHLPELSPERAEILLELTKDVLYQIFIRQKKILEAAEKRKQQIEEKNDNQKSIETPAN